MPLNTKIKKTATDSLIDKHLSK